MNVQHATTIGLIVKVGLVNVERPANDGLELVLRSCSKHIDPNPHAPQLAVRLTACGAEWHTWSRLPWTLELHNLSTGANKRTVLSDWTSAELQALQVVKDMIVAPTSTLLMRAEFVERLAAIVPVSGLAGEPIEWFELAHTLRRDAVRN